jgi:hypothetical protein
VEDGQISKVGSNDDVTVTVYKEVYMETTTTGYTEDSITVDITPKYNLKATIADVDEERNDTNTVTLAKNQPAELASNQTVTVNV